MSVFKAQSHRADPLTFRIVQQFDHHMSMSRYHENEQPDFRLVPRSWILFCSYRADLNEIKSFVFFREHLTYPPPGMNTFSAHIHASKWLNLFDFKDPMAFSLASLWRQTLHDQHSWWLRLKQTCQCCIIRPFELLWLVNSKHLCLLTERLKIHASIKLTPQLNQGWVFFFKLKNMQRIIKKIGLKI